MNFHFYLPLWTIFIVIMWMFYDGFVTYAGLQNAIKERQWAVIIPELPKIIICGLIDVLFNQTFGRLMFLEMNYTLTFSERLDLHYKSSGWRGNMARGIGNKLNAILPTHIY